LGRIHFLPRASCSRARNARVRPGWIAGTAGKDSAPKKKRLSGAEDGCRTGEVALEIKNYLLPERGTKVNIVGWTHEWADRQ
jgi:hypothetical protein